MNQGWVVLATPNLDLELFTRRKRNLYSWWFQLPFSRKKRCQKWLHVSPQNNMCCCGLLFCFRCLEKKNEGAISSKIQNTWIYLRPMLGPYGFPYKIHHGSWGNSIPTPRRKDVQGAEVVKGLGKERHIRRWPWSWGSHPPKVLRWGYGCFPKWWYPTTRGFPTKNDHFGVFWGYHHLRKHPYVKVGISPQTYVTLKVGICEFTPRSFIHEYNPVQLIELRKEVQALPYLTHWNTGCGKWRDF